MKELNAQQTEILINYLNDRINRNRAASEKYRNVGNYQSSIAASAQAAEDDCTLAFLQGLLHGE